ncbi:glycosyltransferase [Salinicoccus carnicancri]|uniref:glycosyltransferase n=1 Tax=Salinicoccus carnicancri TaxID=558170 RepID=UPI0002FE664F|nr:glycosyltransferase [Salinicoccus carnicancri]
MAELNIRKRLQEIEEQKRAITLGKKTAGRPESHELPLSEGISVIIPVHRGEEYIERLIGSLEAQTLEREQFEVIIIFNGEYVRTEEIFNSLETKKQYRVIYTEQGVSRARNAGIDNASYSNIAFLDSDDTISADYLEKSLEACEPFTILLNRLYDVKGQKPDGGANHINRELTGRDTYPESYYSVVKNLSLNGGKVLPTHLLKKTKFDETLNNGEDVLLYMQLISEHKPIVKVNPDEAVYYRHLVDNSLSRTKSNYEFSITDRIAVLGRLQDILKVEDDEEVRTLIIDRMRAQAGFMNRYLKEHMEDYALVAGEVAHYTDEYFPYARMNEDLAKRLYISYCFPPYSDTSGIVMAKRIVERGEPCDVIHNNMYDVRSMDLTLERLAGPFIASRREINTTSSFTNSKYISLFVERAMEKLDIYRYREIYSRALWPASHVLAYEIFKESRNIRWIAEFSDPLYRDIKNNIRQAGFYTKKDIKEIKRHTASNYQKYLDGNLFNMAEVIPFLFAEELVFTNELQLESMIERFDEDFKEMVRQKSVIDRHPTLAPEYYNYQKNYVALDKDKINIGYFGNFYETRNAEEIMNIARIIKAESLDVKIHVFTNSTRQVKSQIFSNGLKDIVEVNPYLRYFEFLSASKEFDYLMLSDARTGGYKRRNPYLPSKFSDYLGSGTKIWVQYEPGSTLASICSEKSDSIICNPLNDHGAIKENLKRITQKEENPV